MSREDEQRWAWPQEARDEQVDGHDGERRSTPHAVPHHEPGDPDAVVLSDEAPASFVESGADDLQAVVACAVIDEVVSGLVPDAGHPDDTCRPPVAPGSGLADDDSVDRALWSLVRENWRRGTPLFGKVVH